MKKIFVAATAAVALATPALAFEVKWSGDFNHRFSYSTQADLSTNASLSGEGYNSSYINGFRNNQALAIAGTPQTDPATLSILPDTKKKANDSDFFADIKYRLTMSATDDDKKVKGVLGFEFGSIKYGQTGDAGIPFAGDKKDTVELRWAYTEFEVPFDTASKLSLGLQPVGYNKFLWSDNAAGAKWTSKRGDLGYSLAWFRDDVTNGGLGGNAKVNKNDVYAADVTYAVPNGPKLNAFVLHEEEGNEALAGAAGVRDTKTWVGLAGEGQAGALFYGFTGIYLTGELDARGTSTFRASDGVGGSIDTGENSLDRQAYLLNAEVTYKLDKTRLKAGWLYASGDDDNGDDKADNFENIDAYMGGFGSVVVFDSMADDNSLVTSPYIADLGLNMPYLSVDYDMTDNTSFGASYLFINTAEGDDDDLGHEFSVRAKNKITKNLTAGIEAGYLLGGDLWDDLATGDEGDDVVRVDASIRYMF